MTIYGLYIFIVHTKPSMKTNKFKTMIIVKNVSLYKLCYEFETSIDDLKNEMKLIDLLYKKKMTIPRGDYQLRNSFGTSKLGKENSNFESELSLICLFPMDGEAFSEYIFESFVKAVELIKGSKNYPLLFLLFLHNEKLTMVIY